MPKSEPPKLERPRRSVVRPYQPRGYDLPFPEGDPDDDNPVEMLVHQLNAGRHTVAQLARVDDFVIRATLETKYNKLRPRDTEVRKWTQQDNLPSDVGLEITRMWRKVRVGPLDTWLAGAKQIWTDLILKTLDAGNPVASLCPNDGDIFASLLVRYNFIYHPESPIKLRVVRFPGEGEPQRGIEAKKPIAKGDFVLEANGIVSSDSPTAGFSRFSIIEHRGRHKTYESILVGPIRFANHHCNPNCEFWNLVDLRDPRMRPSEFYTLRAIRNIAPGEEITLDYGKTYFGSDGLKCLCDACTPVTVKDDRAESQHDPPNQPRPFTEEQPSQTPKIGKKKKTHRGRRRLREDRRT